VLLGLLRRLYPRLDLVLVHGERSRRKFMATWPETPLAVIPHGDERLFAGEPPPPSEEARILFFGDWRRLKGLGVLMEAFDDLSLHVPEATLTIAGTATPEVDREAIGEWAAGHGPRVRLVDRYVPLEQVPALFGQARVVATPYLVGDQSGVVHLAMTMARAVVASDVGDLPASVADGETGLVVPAGEPRALAAALERVVTDRALAERLGGEGRKRVLDGSSWERVAERVELELEKLLSP
jgi:glycosyltransferase involved in cell wall biosynthesis